MTILAVYLAGMSLVIALLALMIAVAEHRRALRIETAFEQVQRRQGEDILKLFSDGATQAKLTAQLAEQDLELQRLISAVAAASAPPSFPSTGKVYISVPGPGTQQ